MLRVDGLCYQYSPRTTPVLSDISLKLPEGKIGILLGRNGAGKSTLFKCLLGINKTHRGTACLDGRDLLHMNAAQRSRLIAYVPQEIQFGDMSDFDSVLMGRISHFGFHAGKRDYEVVSRILEEMHLSELSGRSVRTLSGGERQKTAIARALAQEPRMLIFDEPTGSLDITGGQLILEEAAKLSRQKGISILCSLHDLNQAMAFGDFFYFLKDGTIRCQGGRELFRQDVIRDVFDAKVRIIEYHNEKIILQGGRRNKE